MPAPRRTRLPDLGPRGEGWVALQGVLLVALLASGIAGPAVTGPARLLLLIPGIALLSGGICLGAAGVVRQRRQLTALPRPMAGAQLVDDGPYRLVRHPMYGGIVIASFGWAFATASTPSLVVALVIAGFFDLKSRREEGWLAERFAGYDAYRARTRRLIPWLY